MARSHTRHVSYPRLLVLGVAILLSLSSTPALAQSGVLNTLTKVASATATATSVAAASNPTIELSNTQVPFVLQGPAPAHVNHRGRPRVQNEFSQCSNLNGLDMAEPQNRLNLSAVYAQYEDSPESSVLGEAPHKAVLRILGVGEIASQAYGANASYFSAIQATTNYLNFGVFSNLTYLCDNIYPTAPDTTQEYVGHSSCTYGPGEVAFEVNVPLNATYQMGTLWTQILLIDYSQPARVIACVDVPVSPYLDEDAWYWTLMFWLPIALFVGYFVSVSMARAITAATTRSRAFKNRAREGSSPSFLRDHLNPVIISALSGQGMVLSPALLRFATPGCWEILFHLQFVAMLGMLAVRWPDFSYPFFRQAAWASLLGNMTLIPNESSYQFGPTFSNATLPTGDIGTQMSTPSSILYMDASVPQALLSLGGNGPYTGLSAFASMIGLDDSGLFSTCVAIWLIVVAIFVAVAIVGWFIDTIALAATKLQRRRENRLDYQLADPGAAGLHSQKDGELFMDADGNVKDARNSYYGFLGSWPRGFNPSPHLHWAALHGNIVRAVVMFHLPITILSVNQFANASENNFSTKSVILASVAFAIISVILPAYLVWRIASSPARKLYDDIETLLALGPVYNTYSPGSQLFYAVTLSYSLIAGIVVGASQRSGSAQAIILLVLEVSMGLASMLWLPWGEGGMMGPICFFTTALRVGSVVLVVLLTPIVDLSTRASAWITYVVLLLQGIFFGVLTLIFLVKMLEAIIRMLWRVPYDEKLNARSGGIGGAIRMISRRRDKILQMSNPKRSRRGTSSGGFSIGHNSLSDMPSMKKGDSLSGRSSMMLVGPEGYASGRDANIPLTRSRQASFASYLDFANAANANSRLSPGGAAPLTIAGRPTSATSPGGDFFTSAGAYNQYLQYERNDDEKQMNNSAPLSARSPGEGLPTPIVGFERVSGRRIGETGAEYAPVGRGPGGQEHKEKRSASGKQASELSSTAAAASFARAQSRREARLAASGSTKGKGAGAPSRRRSKFLSRRKEPSEEDHLTSEEDESNLGGTWGTSTLSTQHGPWNGLAKMQAALSNWKEKLGGGGDAEAGRGGLGGISEDEGMMSPGPSSGFQVIRAAPRGRGSRLQPPADKAERELQYSNDDLLDSTAMAAMASSSRPPSSLGRSGGGQNTPPSALPAARGEAEESRRYSTGNGLTITQDRGYAGTPGSGSAPGSNVSAAPAQRPLSATAASYYDPAAAFGILGADLARALTTSSSEGHVEEELGGATSGRGGAGGRKKAKDEERFWLPPTRFGTGGEGVYASSSSSPATGAASGAGGGAAATAAAGAAGSRSDNRQSRIELLDPEEDSLWHGLR
ncbi:hypothetical protein BCV69DRAFT_52302 [Microstroma glucosiphilum]|uniref:TRP C-terminal domain-containing protein n=1 Tax=Pseudomicrostroma glucosiphilum TaxID=1684307 RepID=A0A316U237_9BASI|nr:hypothetical protein BCV69DRAFT_52302 [Pseudomicrostroma glucosiphilum]PWN18884.1 hypothetical protein BCV69DRAFT_52302 [Pseudomicrostroma glucosiphilum]